MAIGVRDISPDTIAAISTAPGRSALAVVRVTGSAVGDIGGRILQPWPLAARDPTLCVLRARDGSIIDRPLVTFFEGPASYTGEDVLEISTHGGYLIPALTMAAVITAGAREAMPGEFTWRAVLNGKMDILQAEAIADLIDAQTAALHRTAVSQLDGSLSRIIGGLREQLIELEALISYEIDFPEEDDGPLQREEVLDAASRIIASLQRLIDTAPTGELIREGAITVIAGPPNAGKSSLFNALLGQARAIVTEIPGTTRDAIEAVVEVQGWPLRLVDTAGLRSTTDIVERLGVEVSERYLGNAQVILLCSEAPDDLPSLRSRISKLSQAPCIDVLTKSDLLPGDFEAPPDVIAVSASERRGLSELLGRIRQILEVQYGIPSIDEPVIVRTRQLQALRSALEEVKAFEEGWRSESLPAPVVAVHLRAATTMLEELIGTVEIDDVLDRVFSSFCIGK
jgi:tRNA modification GTPase